MKTKMNILEKVMKESCIKIDIKSKNIFVKDCIKIKKDYALGCFFV